MVTYDDFLDTAAALDVDIQAKLNTCDQSVVYAFCGILAKRAAVKFPDGPINGLKSAAKNIAPYGSGIAGKTVSDSMTNVAFKQVVKMGFVPDSIEVVESKPPSQMFIHFLVSLSALMEVCYDLYTAPTDILGNKLRDILWESICKYGSTHPAVARS